VTKKADCSKAVDEGTVEPVRGKIFVRPDKVNHCVYSDIPEIKGWHLGTKGDSINCVGQCCEFW
jgi:hypothetical protein